MTANTEGDVRANGISIHYYRTGGNKKPPILLLHGITDSGLCWPKVAHDLSAHYDVVMTDARGHGHSGVSTEDFSITLLADDAAKVIQALKLGRTSVWGHSMGALTAATLAATSPDLVQFVVLEDPPFMDKPQMRADGDTSLFVTNEEHPTQYGWQWLFDLRALPREERIARGFALNPTWAKEEIIPWAASKAELNITILEPAFAAVNDLRWREIIAHIECPFLLVTGDPALGAIITPNVAQEAARLWKNGEVIQISGAGHNIHRDRYDETMERVRTFLSQRA